MATGKAAPAATGRRPSPAAAHEKAKAKAKPRTALPPRMRLHVCVLQGGAPQITASLPVGSAFGRAVRLGRSRRAELFIPHARLPDAVRIFRVGRGRACLYIDPRFEGFLNDGHRFGSTREFIAPRGSLRDLATVLEPLEVPLHPGARGSLRLKGYEILFRVDAREDKPKLAPRVRGAGRGSFLPPASDDPMERYGVWLGALATLLVVVPLTAWLLRAPKEEMDGLANLPFEYATALVHPDHYKVLPAIFRERMDDENPTALAVEWIETLRSRREAARDGKPVPMSGIPSLSDFPAGGIAPVDVETLERRARAAYGAFHAEKDRERDAGNRYFQVLRDTPRVMVDTAGGLSGSNHVRQVRGIQHLRRAMRAVESQELSEQEFLIAHLADQGVTLEKPFAIPKMEVITGPSPSDEFFKDQVRRDKAEQLAEAARKSDLRGRLMRWSETASESASRKGGPSVVWLGTDGALAPAFLAGRLAMSRSPADDLLENARYASGAKEIPPAPRPKPVINMMDVDLLVYAKREEIRACYEAALRRDQRVGGEVAFRLEVDTRGTLAGLAVARTGIPDREFLLCLQRRIQGWRFPPARGGTASFLYPFRFRKGQAADGQAR